MQSSSDIYTHGKEKVTWINGKLEHVSGREDKCQFF